MQVCLPAKSPVLSGGDFKPDCVWCHQDMDEAGIVFLPELLNSHDTTSLLDDQWKSCSNGLSLAFILAWCIYNLHATFDCSSTAHDDLWPRNDSQACCQFVDELFKKWRQRCWCVFSQRCRMGTTLWRSEFFRQPAPASSLWNSLGRILR